MNVYDLSDRYGMLSHGEIDLIAACASDCLDPSHNVVLSVGAGAGTASAAVLSAFPQAIVFSVDRRPIPEEADNLRACGLDASRVLRILADTRHIVWPAACHVDLLILDGQHTDVGVRRELDTFLPALRSGAFVLVHDCYHPNLPGLGEMVDAYLSRAGCTDRHLERYMLAYRNV